MENGMNKPGSAQSRKDQSQLPAREQQAPKKDQPNGRNK